MPLVAVLSSSPPLSLWDGRDDQALMDEVMREFDPDLHLQELSTEWATLQAGVASFDKKFQVSCSILPYL